MGTEVNLIKIEKKPPIDLIDLYNLWENIYWEVHLAFDNTYTVHHIVVIHLRINQPTNIHMYVLFTASSIL